MKHRKGGSYAGEKPARVCMLLPHGQYWFNNHEEAVEYIRGFYSDACRVKRWQENGLQYEDYKDKEGNVLCQLEFAGPPVLAAGFNYE